MLRLLVVRKSGRARYTSTLFVAAAFGSLRPPPLSCRPSTPSPSSCRFSLLLAVFVVVSRPTSSVGSTTAVIPPASWSAQWRHWALLGWLIVVVRIGVRYGGVVLGSSFASGFVQPALCCPHRRSLRRCLGSGFSSSAVLSSLGRIIAVGVICAVVEACEVGYIGSV